MTNLKPLHPIDFFCRNGVHPAEKCRCPEPSEPETYLNSWTAADVKWAMFAIAALIFFVYMGVTVK